MAFYQITLHQSFRSRTFMNVFHLEDVTTPALAPETIANLIESQWIPLFLGCQFTQLRYTQIDVHRILVDPLPVAFTKFINVFGTGSTTAALGFQVWKVTKKSGLLGRKHQGKYYVGGIANGFIDLSSETMGVTATNFFINLVGQLNVRFTDDDATSGLACVIAHKDPAVTPTRVSTFGFDLKAQHLRSRKLGIGI